MNDHFLDSPVDMGPPGSEAVKRESLSEELPFYLTGVRFSKLTPADFGDDDAPDDDDAAREACRRSERVARRKSAQAAAAHAAAADPARLLEHAAAELLAITDGAVAAAADHEGEEGWEFVDVAFPGAEPTFTSRPGAPAAVAEAHAPLPVPSREREVREASSARLRERPLNGAADAGHGKKGPRLKSRRKAGRVSHGNRAR